MNMPDKIKIGGMIYTVEEKADEVRDNRRSGCSNGNAQTIIIDKDITKQFKESTFIHEVLHQIDFIYNIELDHKQVFLLETGIFAFLKDNPNIFVKDEV